MTMPTIIGIPKANTGQWGCRGCGGTRDEELGVDVGKSRVGFAAKESYAPPNNRQQHDGKSQSELCDSEKDENYIICEWKCSAEEAESQGRSMGWEMIKTLLRFVDRSPECPRVKQSMEKEGVINKAVI